MRDALQTNFLRQLLQLVVRKIKFRQRLEFLCTIKRCQGEVVRKEKNKKKGKKEKKGKRNQCFQVKWSSFAWRDQEFGYRECGSLVASMLRSSEFGVFFQTLLNEGNEM